MNKAHDMSRLRWVGTCLPGGVAIDNGGDRDGGVGGLGGY